MLSITILQCVCDLSQELASFWIAKIPIRPAAESENVLLRIR
jgi:hypothetical protein